MTLTVRSATVTGATTKGSALTHAELDENFNHLSQASNISVTQSGTGGVADDLASKIQRDVPQSPDDRVATTGVDDTTALQNCADDGRRIHLVGPYVITSTIDLDTAAAHGLVVFGNGPQSGSGTGTNKSVIRPSSAVSEVFKIDGSGIALAIQNGRFRDFTVDMTNMTDAATSIAFRQMSAYGLTYDNVHVINDGASKLGWKFETGSYTTTMRQCRGERIVLLGTSLANAVTTLNMIGCDFQQVDAQYVVGLNVYGGTVQGTGINKFVLDDINGCSIMGVDVEGTGTYLVIGSNVAHLHSFANEFSGFSGTYSSGTPTDSVLLDYYSGTLETKDSDFKVSGGILSVVKANAALLRCLIENTNASAQQVDLQIKSAAGSSFFGMTSAGTTTIDCRGTTADFEVQDNGSLRLAVVSDKLKLGTTTAATASNGAGEAMKANVSGYIVVTIGSTDFKIPYVAN
jgi:hypothetical protein